MCRRHIISITPHKERSVGMVTIPLKNGVSERRDLYLNKTLSTQNNKI